ncbi:hypothetical protein VTL71DRAFT_503 [Oculimacula yallundae]|uniref:2EXR domain-containing protein n=1 Tax=Oculimacula yallundae TaxID=86028 RepID=A0ABR4D0D6_9HELO
MSDLYTYPPSVRHNQNTEGVFSCFPGLPRELRDEIWKKSVVPCLVHWRTGGGKPLGVFLASKESRAATRGKYELCFTPLGRNGQYGIFINFELDTVYRQQGGLPNMVRQYNFPCQPIDIPNHLSTSTVIKADLWWNVQPWVRYLKTLSIPLKVAAQSNLYVLPAGHFQTPGVTRQSAEGQKIFVKILAMCPDLENLHMILRSPLGSGPTFNELDLGPKRTARYWRELFQTWDPEQFMQIQHVLLTLDKFTAAGHLSGLKLSFFDHKPIFSRSSWDVDEGSAYTLWAGW